MNHLQSIRGKVLLVSGFSTLIILLSLGVTLFGFNKMTSDLLSYITLKEPVYQAEGDLLTIGLQNELSIRNHILDQNDLIPYKIFDKTNTLFMSTVNRLLISPALSANEKESLGQLQRNWENLISLKNTIMKQPGILSAIQNREETQKWRTIRKQILELIKSKNAAIQNEKLQIHQNYRNTLITSILCILSGIMIGMILQIKTVSRITRSMDPLLNAANRLSQRDLTIGLGYFPNDETGRLGSAMKRMLETLTETVSHVRRTSTSVYENAQKVSGIFHKILKISSQNHQNSLSTKKALSSFQSDVTHVETNLEKISRSVEAAMEQVENGNITGRETAEMMIRIEENVHLASQKMDHLEKSMQLITGVTIGIREISEQTNLLALNAAIEAARAGSHGRGFAVVAEEVRKLSDRTNQQTRDIESSILEAMGLSSEATNSMKNVNEIVHQGTLLGQGIIGVFGVIRNGMGDVQASVKEVENRLHGLVGSGNEISLMIEQVESSASHISEEISFGEADIETLEKEVSSLNALMETFKLREFHKEKRD
ncbi:MAG: methyl-accepting chemotaxis protein [Leptospirales bacterium]